MRACVRKRDTGVGECVCGEGVSEERALDALDGVGGSCGRFAESKPLKEPPRLHTHTHTRKKRRAHQRPRTSGRWCARSRAAAAAARCSAPTPASAAPSAGCRRCGSPFWGGCGSGGGVLSCVCAVEAGKVKGKESLCAPTQASNNTNTDTTTQTQTQTNTSPLAPSLPLLAPR